MLHQVFNDAFEALLAGWHRHMDLAAATDNAVKLAESRTQLEELRERAYRVGRAATGDDGLMAAYCPFLQTMVYIPTSEIRYTRRDALVFDCACGRNVEHRPSAWLRDVRKPAFASPTDLREAGRRTATQATRP